jgi:hypothetical protein
MSRQLDRLSLECEALKHEKYLYLASAAPTLRLRHPARRLRNATNP